jgi:hypothetical protein
MQAVYGDSLTERGGWVDLDRIDAEVEALLEHDPAQAERFFLNRKLASEGAAFDFEKWLDKARKRKAPPKGSPVVIGVDGALNDDALAVVACEIKTGFVWPLGIWERPVTRARTTSTPSMRSTVSSRRPSRPTRCGACTPTTSGSSR